MKKEEKEYIELTAESVATKVIEKFIDKLPCNNHDERIRENEKILTNGLKEGQIENRKSIRKLRWWLVIFMLTIIGSIFADKII